MRSMLLASAVALSLAIVAPATTGAMTDTVRWTGDAGVNAMADVDALIEEGSAALIRHDFAAALEIGSEARAAAPASTRPMGIVVDALIELGRYEEAGDALELMLRTRPDLSSYARLSYFHELHGRIDLAIEAMELALVAGGPTPADTEFARLHLAHLHLLDGETQQASDLYTTVLRHLPEHTAAMAGLARTAAAAGDLEAAADHLTAAITLEPLPEYVVALAELQDRLGDHAVARASFAIGVELERAHAAKSAVPEPYSAILETDHGDPAVGLELAQAAYASAPSIGAADALAWALHANGRHDEASLRSTEALRTGTRSPLILYHAGVVTAAAGELPKAMAHLQASLEHADAVSPGLRAQATAALSRLDLASASLTR